MNKIVNPEQWTRLPSTGEKFMGMSRSTITRLTETGKIRKSTIIQPGRKTGIVFFSAADLISLISQSSNGNGFSQS